MALERVYLFLKEPVGSKAPSVAGDAKRWLVARESTQSVIPCQAQGHPVPSFR